MRIVLASGVFDILHIGHIEHLREARSMGDRLIVALTNDPYVKKGPGRPRNKWEDRAELLRELRCVSEVQPSDSSIAAIRKIRPHIFVKGIDYADGTRFTEEIEKACKTYHCELRFTSTPKRSVDEIIERAKSYSEVR